MLRLLALTAALAAAAPAAAEKISWNDRFVGLNARSTIASEGPLGGELVVIEPAAAYDALMSRDDLVLLMRHGPTDWSVRDILDVGSDDCANQRILSPAGVLDMINLGALLAENGIRPTEIYVSEWCRNQQTMDALMAGFERVDPDWAGGLDPVTDPGLNLLLSGNGAATVRPLRSLINAFGLEDRPGPMLIVTHYTNIEELTDFRIYEGEMLIVDPKDRRRVLGTLRLDNASPDVGHFQSQQDALEAEGGAD